MSNKKAKKGEGRVIHAYEQILEYVKKFQEEHRFTDAIKQAQETLLKAGEFTREEIELAAKYVTRDFADMAYFLHDAESGLVDWLLFDVELIAERLWESFSSLADQALLDRQALFFRLEHGPIYKTGEVTGIGSLQCDYCGQTLHFHKVSHIPPCPNCHKSSFARMRNKHPKPPNESSS